MEKAQMKYMEKLKNIFYKNMILWVTIYKKFEKLDFLLKKIISNDIILNWGKV